VLSLSSSDPLAESLLSPDSLDESLDESLELDVNLFFAAAALNGVAGPFDGWTGLPPVAERDLLVSLPALAGAVSSSEESVSYNYLYDPVTLTSGATYLAGARSRNLHLLRFHNSTSSRSRRPSSCA
jgi:hypothetical protein